MPDPFEALREPAPPVAPDPLFAAHLRARLARALELPKGVTVSNLATAELAFDPEVAASSDPVIPSARTPALAPAPARPSDLIYVSLWVPDVTRAAAFFGDVLGWRYRPGSGDQGRQVESLSIRHGLFGGQDHSTLFLCFGVDDVAAAVVRVRAAGGEAAEPTVERYGRIANCVDDQGVAFAAVETPAAGPAGRGRENGERPGDVAYVTMEVEDSAKARAFYGSVLGWQFHPGRVTDGWGVADVVPMTGMHGGHPQATTVPMYRVDDIAAAVARVRARGGTATDPEAQGYGITADCADDQGTRFYLGQL